MKMNNMQTLSENQSLAVNSMINSKLKAACWICGITVKDTASGKKHINKIEYENSIVFMYAEEQLALLGVLFTDQHVYIRRIRVDQYLWHKVKSSVVKIFNKLSHGCNN